MRRLRKWIKRGPDAPLPYALWVEYDEETNQVRFYDPTATNS